jgi:hypothetical protein
VTYNPNKGKEEKKSDIEIKDNEIDQELNNLIIAAINAGICSDVVDRLHYDNFTEEFIFSATDGYDFKKTLIFVEEKITAFNRASRQHTHRK